MHQIVHWLCAGTGPHRQIRCARGARTVPRTGAASDHQTKKKTAITRIIHFRRCFGRFGIRTLAWSCGATRQRPRTRQKSTPVALVWRFRRVPVLLRIRYHVDLVRKPTRAKKRNNKSSSGRKKPRKSQYMPTTVAGGSFTRK